MKQGVEVVVPENLSSDPETLRYENVRKAKCCLQKDNGLPIIFTVHESQIEDVPEGEDSGQIREQHERFVNHIADKQMRAPNAKHQDPYEVTLVKKQGEPWTEDRDLFVAKMAADPSFAGFSVRNWAHQHLYASRKKVANFFAGQLIESTFRHHQIRHNKATT